MTDRTTRVLAVLALALSFLALVLAGYALQAQRESEERLRGPDRWQDPIEEDGTEIPVPSSPSSSSW